MTDIRPVFARLIVRLRRDLISFAGFALLLAQQATGVVEELSAGLSSHTDDDSGGAMVCTATNVHLWVNAAEYSIVLYSAPT